MSAKSQHQHILLVAAGITLVVVLVGVIGMLALRSEEPTIQGEVEVSEYRVSSKLPGRILELRVKEGIKVSRVYHCHCLFFGSHSLIYKVTGYL